MNERIKELIEELWQEAVDATWADNSKAAHEKFAELIVRECASIARNTDLEDIEGGDSAVLGAARNQILEHFGVK